MTERKSVAMGVELDEVRDHLSELVDRVELHRERVTLTRDGRPVVVLINPDDLAELEETLDVLLDPRALADISEGDNAYVAGDVLRGPDAVTNLDPTSRGDHPSPGR
jgi:antitoxin YefM